MTLGWRSEPCCVGIGYLLQEELLDRLGYSITAVTTTMTATTGIQGIQPLWKDDGKTATELTKAFTWQWQSEQLLQHWNWLRQKERKRKTKSEGEREESRLRIIERKLKGWGKKEVRSRKRMEEWTQWRGKDIYKRMKEEFEWRSTIPSEPLKRKHSLLSFQRKKKKRIKQCII